MWLCKCYNKVITAIPCRSRKRLLAKEKHVEKNISNIFTRFIALCSMLCCFSQNYSFSQSKIYSSVSDSSENWVWQNPLPQGNTLYSIASLDTLRAIAVGGAGTVLYTTDGGANWKTQQSLFNSHSVLKSVQFFNDSVAWAVGDSGMVLFSSDGGANWSRRSVTASVINMNKIQFVTNQIGYIAGEVGVMLKTTTGGSSWDLKSLYPYRDINSMSFVSPTRGWAVGDSGMLLRTVNGGNTWDPLYLSTRQFRDVHFFDDSLGWIASTAGSLFSTLNGDAPNPTWVRPNIGTTSTLNAVSFIDQFHGVTVGENGNWNIATSIDGGDTWDPVLPKPDTVNMNSVSLQSAFGGWVVGDKGRIYKISSPIFPTLTFTPQSFGTITDLTDIHVIDSLNAVAVGGLRTTMKTSDGGATWTTIRPNVLLNSIDLIGLDFADNARGCAVGSSQNIILTTDAGNSWSRVYSPITKNSLRAIKFLDSVNVIAAGDSGVTVSSTNGGSSWQVVTSGKKQYTIRSLYAVSSTKLWASGDSAGFGRIFRSADSGATWTNVPVQPALTLNNIFFSTPAVGWAVGDGDIIMRTLDSGATWLTRPKPFPARSMYRQINLNDIYFLNDNVGWIAADNGIMLKTTNAGFSWQQLQSNSEQNLTAIRFIDSLTGWTVGVGGTILKTRTSGGISYTIYPVPAKVLSTEVKAFQNFPNPFTANQTTRFKVEVGKTTEGTVKIFNIIGQLVFDFPFYIITSVRAEYEVGSWNGFDKRGNNVPSGIYFFVVTTPTSIIPGKMVYIK